MLLWRAAHVARAPNLALGGRARRLARPRSSCTHEVGSTASGLVLALLEELADAHALLGEPELLQLLEYISRAHTQRREFEARRLPPPAPLRFLILPQFMFHSTLCLLQHGSSVLQRLHPYAWALYPGGRTQSSTLVSRPSSCCAGSPYTKWNDGLETRVLRLRPRDALCDCALPPQATLVEAMRTWPGLDDTTRACCRAVFGLLQQTAAFEASNGMPRLARRPTTCHRKEKTADLGIRNRRFGNVDLGVKT